jgi:hypothetical protein
MEMVVRPAGEVRRAVDDLAISRKLLGCFRKLKPRFLFSVGAMELFSKFIISNSLFLIFHPSRHLQHTSLLTQLAQNYLFFRLLPG